MSKQDRIYELSIYKKAEVLFQLVESLVAILPDNDDLVEATKDFMLASAMILPAKIAGAEGASLYSVKMQNAAIIREHAMSLYVQVGSLRFKENFKDIEYVLLIRRELDEFRMMFIDWVSHFDIESYVWDDWEFFNPKGAVPPSENCIFDEDTFDYDATFGDFDADFDADFEEDVDDEE
ncbi:hypothetical protein [Flavobacterium sp. 7A]|uniref:hypothetical protein n=1 Tax=Flavobacterium sp. 7A TaxID=2940571 RepID=UPI0022279B3D|nr:hypothetical protein [Flavobacterium sp. 7A]MCW2120121.1 hypothetical protein [Flavobacterium sp. 7A]